MRFPEFEGGGVVDGVFRPISGLQNFGGSHPKS